MRRALLVSKIYYFMLLECFEVNVVVVVAGPIMRQFVENCVFVENKESVDSFEYGLSRLINR